MLVSTGEVHTATASLLVDMEVAESAQVRLQGNLNIDYRRTTMDAKPMPSGEAAPETVPAADERRPAAGGTADSAVSEPAPQ